VALILLPALALRASLIAAAPSANPDGRVGPSAARPLSDGTPAARPPSPWGTFFPITRVWTGCSRALSRFSPLACQTLSFKARRGPVAWCSCCPLCSPACRVLPAADAATRGAWTGAQTPPPANAPFAACRAQRRAAVPAASPHRGPARGGLESPFKL